MDETTIECPTCGGVGRDLVAGQLVTCDDCGGAGRVPGMKVYPFAAYVTDDPAIDTAPVVIPIPQEYRHE